MFRLRAEAKAIEFVVKMEGLEGCYIQSDEGKIRQILINLLSNAVKFTEQGSVLLSARLEKRGSRLWLCVEIEDTGVGIPADEVRLLFQPFVQGQEGRRLRHGGTGLGLSISEGLSKLLDGHINVSSTPGSGSTFRLQFPVELGSGQNVRRDFDQSGRVLRLHEGQETPRILIADDVPDSREWLSRLLTSLGFDVRAVAEGEAAVRSWKEWNPHLILMDIHMPVLGGLEATRHIRAAQARGGPVIIALSADVMAENRSAVLRAGLDDFLPKPCPETELLTKLRVHLNLDYIYKSDPQQPGGEMASGEPVRFPPNLSERLREATLSGDKLRMNLIIRSIKEIEGGRSAELLQQLADTYQYDRLIHLLENSCHP
jgi:CheY-like chemotaxis protein